MQLGYHLNRPFGREHRYNFSAFANPLSLTFGPLPPGASGVNLAPQLTLDVERLSFGPDAQHSVINTGVNVSIGTQKFAPISALSTSTGPSTAPNALPTSTFVPWPVNLGIVPNLTANLFYHGDTPMLTPWIEGYAGITAPGNANSAATVGGSAGAALNLRLSDRNILSIGGYGGLRIQWADVARTWTSQSSWYLGGGAGLTF